MRFRDDGKQRAALRLSQPDSHNTIPTTEQALRLLVFSTFG